MDRSTEATLPAGAQTGSIDLVVVTEVIANVVTQVLRQVMVVGDPLNGSVKASVLPDQVQGWENGLAVQIMHSHQLNEINNTMLKILAELQRINVNTGGLPVTDTIVG